MSLHHAVYRKDFLSFLMRAYAVLEPGRKLITGRQHEAMTHELACCADGSNRRLIMTMPPRSLKSTMVSVVWTAFLLGHDPTSKIMCVSYSEDLASLHSRNTRRLMESRFYRQVFPGTVLAKSSEMELETTQGGLRYATSVGGTVTGRGADWIIIDDPSKADDALSKAALEKVAAFYTNTLSTRLNDPPTGRIILVMQRLHEEDLAGVLLSGGGWKELKLPARATEDCLIATGTTSFHQRRQGDLLDPTRLPLSYLMERERQMGSAAYQAQYQQEPVPAEGNLIKREWICTYKALPALESGRVIQSLDTAQKTAPSNDYSVLTTWLWVVDKFYLVDVFRERVDYPSLKAAIIRQHDRYRPERVLVEDIGAGTSLMQDLRACRGDIRAFPIKAREPKEVRVGTVSALFQNKQVFFPVDAHWLDQCEREVLGFPGAKHDDIIDSIAHFLNWTRTQQGAHFDCYWPGLEGQAADAHVGEVSIGW